MKQLIVPIAIIVALIAFFVIIDRKEFSRHDVQTVQSESPTSNRNPTLSVPETKSVSELNPAVETKSGIETKPIAEAKSVTETRTDKTAEPSVAQTKPEEMAKPAVVPVATAKEAEKLNEDAKAYVLTEKERIEPFYKFYQDSKLDSVCFQGTIRATSTIPDPEKNDYDNCLYALFIELDSYFADKSLNQEMPCEAIIAVPIMKDKAINRSNIFQLGDKVLCTCAEYDSMPQNIQEIQFSDDIQSFEHQLYYVLTINKINAFILEGSKKFAKREITILPIQKLQKDETIAKARKERIQNEIRRIENELEKHGGNFDSWKEEYKAIDKKYKTLCSEDWKGWIKDSFFYAKGSETSVYKTKEYIEGILPYKKYLEENNIDLILMRYPSKADFAARVLGADDFQENPAWVQHYYECLKNDIEIVDPMPEMWKHRFDYPLFYFYNLPSETHPLEGELMVAAKVLSDVLERYDLPKEDSLISLQETSYSSSDAQFFYPEGNPKFSSEDNISFHYPIQNNESIKTLQLNSSHPVIFLSNSHFGGYPFRDFGASIPGYSAFFLQTKPDWLYQSGIGNAMIRNLISSPYLLGKRRVVVMVASFTMWNRSFPPFPKYLSDHTRSIFLEKTIDFLSSDIKMFDNDSFLFSKDINGLTCFTQNPAKNNPNNDFRIELEIPCGPEGEQTCMLRINYGYNSQITMEVQDSESQGNNLDTMALASGSNLHADIYIPVSKDSRRISILFKPGYPTRKYLLKNIELWYY